MNKETDNYNRWNPALSEQALRVFRDGATEPPNTGKYLHNSSKPGIYYCANCQHPLYSSTAQFESHCGWPSFYKELDSNAVSCVVQDDARTEVTCTGCGGHLGHVFTDEGWAKRLNLPKDTRYCINSVCLDFVEGNNNDI